MEIKQVEILKLSDEEFVKFHKAHKGHKLDAENNLKCICSCGYIFSVWDIWFDIPKRLKAIREQMLAKLELKRLK